MTRILTFSERSLTCVAATGVALLTLPILSLSQESQPTESTEIATGDIEEVIVYGEVPLTQLRAQAYRAMDKYFATFNELNSRDEFDIRCRWVAPTGTRIAQRVCRAKFVNDLEARAYREAVPFASFSIVMREKEDLLQNKMRELVLEHPELLGALSEFGATEDRYKAERERRCADRIFVCRR